MKSVIGEGTYALAMRTLRKATVFPVRLAASSSIRRFVLRPWGEMSLAPLRDHLDGAAEWLFRAQDAQTDGGVSGYFQLHGGWTHSYPETTGYAIPTFLKYAARNSRPADIHRRASRMVDFVLSTQREEGWFPGGDIASEPKPSVFNSGMILHGLNHYLRFANEERIRDAATRCANWICDAMAADGTWANNNYRGLSRTYNSEVSASLAELYAITGSARYAECAARANDWILAQQRPSGWFANCDSSVELNDAPLTHLIGYTTRGLAVSGKILERSQDIDGAYRCLQGLMEAYPAHTVDYIRGRFDSEWRPRMRAACVTGTAQLAVTLLLINEHHPDAANLQYARWLIEQIARMQDLDNPHPGLRGGLPSSFPAWGTYSQLTLNNWGVKYMMDAIMLLDDAESTRGH